MRNLKTSEAILLSGMIAMCSFGAGAAERADNDCEYTPERLKKCLEQKAPRLKDYEKAKYAFALKSAEKSGKQLKWAIQRLESNRGPVTPRPERSKWWMPRHEAKLKQIRECGGKIDIVFLGDSISHGWEGWNGKGPGSKVLAEIRKDYSVLVAGFGGDRTFHAIWRAENGELDGYEAAEGYALRWVEPEEAIAQNKALTNVYKCKYHTYDNIK